jgi:type IX secretion system PorP/SprF family membrane protein
MFKKSRYTGVLSRLNILRAVLLISLMTIFIPGLRSQQEPMYSQYMFNMLQINPAYAGNRANDNITLVYRNQWTGIDKAPVTGTLSWDRRSPGSNVGYGLQLYSDEIGIERSVGLQAFYSFRILFENSALTMGLSAGVMNYRANYTELETVSANDPLFMQNVNGYRPTVGLGLLYAREKWYAGFSVPSLLQTKVYDDNVSSTLAGTNHYFLTGGYLFDLNEDFKLKPSVLVKAVTGAPIEFDFNANVWYRDAIGLGVSYRTEDSFVGMLELQLTQQLRLGYAYDYTASPLRRYSGGTHEVMLRYEFGGSKSQAILSPRYY